MNDCPSERELTEYHDGELPSDRRETLATHIATCSPCREILSQWTAISSLFHDASHQKLSAIARARVYRRMDELTDRGLMRLAWTFSGLAASVLLFGSIWLMHTDGSATPVTASAPPWVGVTYAADVGSSQREPATPAAEWYLASNVGTSSDELP